MFEEGITIMANLGTEGFKKGTKEIERAVKSLSNSAKKFSMQMTGTIRRLIPMILGVGSAYQVISKGVSAFMSQNEELSARMSAIWTAVGNLLGPIITQIIDWVTTAVSYFISFLNLLGITGKSASELSKSAKKSAGDLQRTLAGFDELNVLQDNSGGGKERPLKDLDPAEWMKKLAELLKNKMWDEAADMIIAGMNKLIYTMRDKAYEFGQVVGEYLGAALHIIGRVIDEVDWHALGETLALFINGIFNHPNMKGEDLGKILVGKFTIAFKTLTGFLETLDWETIADYLTGVIIGALDSIAEAIEQADFQKIGAGIVKFFKKLWDNKDEIADAIFRALKSAWDAALDLLWGILAGDSEQEPPLVGSLRKLGEAVEGFVSTVGSKLQPVWENVLKPLGEWLLNTALPAAIDTITQELERFTSLLSGDMNLGEFLGSMTELERIATLVGLAFGAIKLTSFIGEVEKLGGLLPTLIQHFGGTFGGVESLITALAGINPVVLGVIAVIGAFIAEFVHLYNKNEEFRQKIDEVWTNIKGVFERFFESVRALFNGDIGLAEFIGNIIGGLARLKLEIEEGIAAFFEALGQDLWEKITGIWDKIQEAWKQVVDWWHEVAFEDGKFTIQGLFDGIVEKITGIGTWIMDHIINPFINGFKNGFGIASPSTVMAELGGFIIEGLLNGIKALLPDLDGIRESIVGAFSNMKEKVVGFLDSINPFKPKVEEMATSAQGLAEQANYFREVASHADEALYDMMGTCEYSLGECMEAEEALTMVYEELAKQLGLSTEELMNQIAAADGDVTKIAALKDVVIEAGEAMLASADSYKRGSEAYDQASADVAEASERAAETVTTSTETINEVTAANTEAAAENATTNSATAEQNTTSSFEEMNEQATAQMQSLAQNANNIFSMLASNASVWGTDLMVNFVNGINAMIPALESTLIGIANMVNSYIGFSKPDKGPLSDFDEYGPDMMDLLAEGIEGGAGRLASALNDIAETVSYQMPAVAGGAILPYGVAAATGMGSGDAGTGGSAADAIAQLINAITALQHAIEDNEYVLDFGDFRQIARAVTKTQRRMSRAEGV